MSPPLHPKRKGWRRFIGRHGQSSTKSKDSHLDVGTPTKSSGVAIAMGSSPGILDQGSLSPSNTPLSSSSPCTADASFGTPEAQFSRSSVNPVQPMIIVSEPGLEGEHETHAPDSDLWADTEEEPLDGETAEGTGRLWSEAYLKLEKDDTCKSLIASYKVLLNGDIQEGDEKYKDPSKQEQMTDLVGEKLETMTKKQWTLTWGKTSFVIREQAKKIIKVVQTFSEIGTVVARLDPAHAGIAWAGVCALLPLIMNDFTEQQKAMDGLEEVSKILARYSAIEKLLIARKTNETDIDFEHSIIALYMAVLKYQATAAYHFGRKTFLRMIANIAISNDWTEMFTKMKAADQNCQAFVAVKSTQLLLKRLQSLPQGFDRDLYEKWQADRVRGDAIMRQWIDNRIDASQAHQDQNDKIINWISDVKVGHDHRVVRERLGDTYWSSGQWFLNPPAGEINLFERWKLSHRGQLWLQGSVGTGKSSLTSIVINHLIENSPRIRLAFHYCSRNSTANAPLAILRSLVAQLAWSSDGLEVSDLIKKMRKKQSEQRNMDSPFSVSDCVDLLVALIAIHGPTTIVLDGLDECEGPMTLLWRLFDVWAKSPHLKVFFSSRQGVEICKAFPDAVVIRTESEKSASDVQRYINKELSRKERRNDKVVSDELAERMVAILTQLSDGMFRWVELQLDLFISSERPIRHRRDFEARLKRLEADHASGREVIDRLGETYEEIFERNVQGDFSLRLAIRALQWVLCVFRPFELQELRSALAVGDEDVTEELLLDLCSNFIHVDGEGFVRLSHISVKEYLELKEIKGHLMFSSLEAHTEAAMTCLQYWKLTFKEHRPPIVEEKQTAYLGDRLPFQKERLSPKSHVLVRHRRNGRTSQGRVYSGNLDSNFDDYVVEDLDLAEAVTTSWRSYAALYWVSHYKIVIQLSSDSVSTRSDTTLKSLLVQFLSGIDGNTALSNWLAEMAQLRYAFRRLGSGLGDRTPSPGPVPSSRSRSCGPISHSEAHRINPEVGDELDELKLRRYTDRWDREGGIGAEQKPNHAHAELDEIRRGNTALGMRLNSDYTVMMPERDYRKTLVPKVARGSLDLYESSNSATFIVAGKRELPRMQVRPLSDGRPYPSMVQPHTQQPLQTQWLSQSSYDKDQALFWNTWEAVSAFPLKAYDKGKRRIVFLTACVWGFTNVIRAVCDVERCTRYRNHTGMSGLHLAARHGHLEVVRLLMEHGSSDEYEPEAGTTALHESCSEGNLEVVQFLLKSLPPEHVNIRDSLGRTPLHIAVEDNRIEIVAVLLKQPSILVNAQDRDGSTALHAASRYSKESLQLLLADPAIDKDIRDVFGRRYNDL